MAKLLKLRRGTTSQHSSFTGAEGEVTVDTTKDTLVVHDGSTAGGTPLAKESDNLSLIDEDNMSTNSATRPPSQQSVKAYVDAQTLSLIDEDNMSSDSATRPPSQQSVKAYADTKSPAILDEDNLGSDSATRPPSQQSVKAYVDAQTLTLIDEDNLGSNADNRPPSQQSVKAYVDTNFAPKAAPTFTGNASGANLTLSGNLTVNGTTTTVATTNTTLTDNLLELNSGASSNANDAGILIERGSTGDNAIIAWDESADKFTVGTTTGTASSTGDISITTGTLVANVEGNVTGNLTGTASSATNADTVDNLHAASFLRSDADDTSTGKLTINNSADEKLVLSGSSAPYIRFKEGSTNKSYIKWETAGYLQFANEEDGSVLRLKDHLTLSWDGSTHYDVLHQGNLGSSGALSSSNVYIQDVYASEWFRVSTQDRGIYSSVNDNYLYSDAIGFWTVSYNGSEGGLRIRDGFNGTVRGALFATDNNGIGFTDNNSSWALQSNRGTNQCHLYDQHFISDTNNSYDLGTTSARWRNGYFGTKVYDELGNLRSLVYTSKSSAHTLVAGDAGKVVYISTGGVTIPNSVMSGGDMVTIINNSGSDQTLTQASGLTLYNTADASTGNRTLAGRGMATVWFHGGSVAYISGSGLS